MKTWGEYLSLLSLFLALALSLLRRRGRARADEWLGSKGASFAENFYGLKRRRTTGGAGGEKTKAALELTGRSERMGKREIRLSLVFLVRGSSLLSLSLSCGKRLMLWRGERTDPPPLPPNQSRRFIRSIGRRGRFGFIPGYYPSYIITTCRLLLLTTRSSPPLPFLPSLVFR